MKRDPSPSNRPLNAGLFCRSATKPTTSRKLVRPGFGYPSYENALTNASQRMAYDETLAARVRNILSPASGLSEKKMFGGLCFLIHGNMCCGVLKNELVLRVEPEQAQELLHRAHTRPMDFTGRPMKGFVFVEAGGLGTDRQLCDWVSIARSFSQSLPRKSGGKSSSRRSTARRAARPRA
jgi:hypothetical protein